jgi:Ca-activated chloride channel family protein
LPDIFHGDQLVVLARYHGAGPRTVKLQGKVGGVDRSFDYEVDFAARADQTPFVEELWARRKVGYLLDQIRAGGEQTELVEEVTRLARQYGITTPYTSYLIMPDAPLSVAMSAGKSGEATRGGGTPLALGPGSGFGGALPASGRPGGAEDAPATVEYFARAIQGEAGGIAKGRGDLQDRVLDEAEKRARDGQDDPAQTSGDKDALERLAEAKKLKGTLDAANHNFEQGQWRKNQVSTLGVDLAVCTNDLKRQSQLVANAIRRVGTRTCLEIGGVWIDEGFTPSTPAVTVKAQSPAYFQMLKRQPQVKDVLTLGNHVVWIAPSGTALVIDTTDGAERLSDREIDALFAAKN